MYFAAVFLGESLFIQCLFDVMASYLSNDYFAHFQSSQKHNYTRHPPRHLVYDLQDVAKTLTDRVCQHVHLALMQTERILLCLIHNKSFLLACQREEAEIA